MQATTLIPATAGPPPTAIPAQIVPERSAYAHVGALTMEFMANWAPHLPADAISTYMALISFSNWTTGIAFPSYTAIASRAGVSRDTVRRWLGESPSKRWRGERLHQWRLFRDLLVHREHRGFTTADGKRWQESNAYTLPALVNGTHGMPPGSAPEQQQLPGLVIASHHHPVSAEVEAEGQGGGRCHGHPGVGAQGTTYPKVRKRIKSFQNNGPVEPETVAPAPTARSAEDEKVGTAGDRKRRPPRVPKEKLAAARKAADYIGEKLKTIAGDRSPGQHKDFGNHVLIAGTMSPGLVAAALAATRDAADSHTLRDSSAYFTGTVQHLEAERRASC